MWGFFSALLWIGGIVFIIERYILGVKVRVNMSTFEVERKRNRTRPKNGIYLSNDEELRRQTIRDSRESAISKR